MADESTQIRIIVNDLESFTEKVCTFLTIEATANLIEATPVDTGWARANWIPRIGRPAPPPTGDAPRRQAGQAARSGTLINQTSEQSAGQASALRYRLNQGRIFITNNVPYIGRLNQGHSPQAPPGFVQRAIRRAIGRLRNIRP